ncbi:transporter [Robbsia andropogonis]|uniref:Transporter n=1 Tax=Robbsia andropogonis TaxID=28092 RepID=A0A0F5JW77_9BURK|nr:AEC family transporter [Robbsia andropogonis]KKB62078.1 transporter [Robbsia andropogonis]MCP1117416.1 AEC family transporter [Robbsia andropogonis]MCP1126882.1 AEC family transporter [Robbsia andropogonis]
MYALIVTALLPVFLVLVLGYIAGKRKLVDNQNVSSLNGMLMQFALPLALFVSIAHTPQSVILQNGMLALVLAIGLLLVYAVTYAMQRQYYKLPLGDAAVETLTIAFPNFASIGLPLLLPVFGAQAALPVAIAIAVGSVTISPLTLALLELHKARAGGSTANVSATRQFVIALRHSVRKPIFYGPMLGLVCALSGFQLPDLVIVGVGPLTNATAGLGLFLTGLMLSAQPIRITSDVVFGTCMKNVVQPLLIYALVRLFDIPMTVGAQAVLLTAIPSGFFGLVFGAGCDLRPPVAGSTLVVSSLSGIVTLSIAILLFAPHH